VKLLDLSQTPDDNVENFVKEIKLIEALEHPNIIKYLGHDLVDGNVRCFMEYYPFSLYMLLKRRQKDGFSLHEVAFMGREITNGLHYLHNLPSKIIHRDLKSGNILVGIDENDEVKTVKITDFDASAIMNNTQMNVTVIGTGAWMAPEVFTHEGYSVEADIWSFGMLLFEMVALKQPYHTIPPMQVPTYIVKGTLPEFPNEPNKQFEPIIEIMKLCLVVEPSLRPTATALNKMFVKVIGEYDKMSKSEAHSLLTYYKNFSKEVEILIKLYAKSQSFTKGLPEIKPLPTTMIEILEDYIKGAPTQSRDTGSSKRETEKKKETVKDKKNEPKKKEKEKEKKKPIVERNSKR